MDILKNAVIFVALVCGIHWYLTAGWKEEGKPMQLYDENTPALTDPYKPAIDKARNVAPTLQQGLDKRMQGR